MATQKFQIRRFEIIKSMNTLIQSLNNEDAYYEWIIVVPDEANDDDFMDIASDEELFRECVKLYKRLYEKYIEDGIFDGVSCW